MKNILYIEGLERFLPVSQLAPNPDFPRNAGTWHAENLLASTSFKIVAISIRIYLWKVEKSWKRRFRKRGIYGRKVL